MARSHRGSRGARSTRVPVWVSFSSGTPQTVTNAGVILGVANAALLALRPFTIIRTRGVFLVTSDQSATGETSHGALASHVIDEESVDAGVGAVPTPIDDPDSKYFLFESYIHELQISSAVGEQSPAGTYARFDSKAMRKVSLGQDIYIVAENESTEGSIITVQGRMLLKLH